MQVPPPQIVQPQPPAEFRRDHHRPEADQRNPTRRHVWIGLQRVQDAHVVLVPDVHHREMPQHQRHRPPAEEPVKDRDDVGTERTQQRLQPPGQRELQPDQRHRPETKPKGHRLREGRIPRRIAGQDHRKGQDQGRHRQEDPARCLQPHGPCAVAEADMGVGILAWGDGHGGPTRPLARSSECLHGTRGAGHCWGTTLRAPARDPQPRRDDDTGADALLRPGTGAGPAVVQLEPRPLGADRHRGTGAGPGAQGGARPSRPRGPGGGGAGRGVRVAPLCADCGAVLGAGGASSGADHAGRAGAGRGAAAAAATAGRAVAGRGQRGDDRVAPARGL